MSMHYVLPAAGALPSVPRPAEAHAALPNILPLARTSAS